MRRLAVIILVVLQAGVLAYMAIERESILRSGKIVHIRTAPIDPRDVFRGDFVVLDYELSPVNRSKRRGNLILGVQKKGDKVYAVLKDTPGDLVELDYLTDIKPAAGKFIRGRLTHNADADRLSVKYGIEQFFVEQGAGLEIERKRGQRDTLQTPMEVAVALSDSGTGVIKGYRWSRVGIALEILRLPRRNANTEVDEVDGPLSPKLRLTIKNVSEQALSLVDFGEHCAFELIPIRDIDAPAQTDPSECDDHPILSSHLIALGPEQEYSVEFDLSDTRWFVRQGNEVGEIGRLFDNWERFRLVYRSPNTQRLAHLSDAAKIWHGYLPSPAFTAFGRID